MSDGDVIPEESASPHVNTTAENEADESKLRAAIAVSVLTTIGCVIAGATIGAKHGHKVLGGFAGVPVAWIASKVTTAAIAPNYEATWKRLNDPSKEHPSDSDGSGSDPGSVDTGSDVPVREKVSVTDIAANLNDGASGWSTTRRLNVAGMIRNLLSGDTLSRESSNAAAMEANTEANEHLAAHPVATEDSVTADRRSRYLANRITYPGISDADNNRLVNFTMGIT